MDAIKAMRLGKMAQEVNTDGEGSWGLSWVGEILHSWEAGKSVEVPLTSNAFLRIRESESRGVVSRDGE